MTAGIPEPSVRRTVAALAVWALVGACQGTPSSEGYAPAYATQPVRPPGTTTLLFAVHPLHSIQHLYEVYGPLVDRLNRALRDVPGDFALRLTTARDYVEFDRRLEEGSFDFSIGNPYQTIRAIDAGYAVVVKFGDDDQFRGIVLTRRDDRPADVLALRGKVVAFPHRSAIGATMMTERFLQRQGLDLDRDIERRYLGSHESSIMALHLGHAAAAATRPQPWEAFAKAHPEIAAELEVRWTTSTLPNNGVVARTGISQPVIARVREALLALDGDDEGRTILAAIPLTRFESATDDTYVTARAFLAEFAATVRPVTP